MCGWTLTSMKLGEFGPKRMRSLRFAAMQNLTTPLKFVRFEPFVLPKKSLTGDSTERVDTRVLQVIYRVERDDLRLFVGQQMDVFIDAPLVSANSKTSNSVTGARR